MKQITIICLTAILLAICLVSCSKNTEEPAAKTSPSDFHGIPPGGIGGDSIHNTLKNRWYIPKIYDDVSISGIMNFPHTHLDSMGSKDRKNWTSSSLNEAAVSEMLGVRTTGFLIASKEEGPESCNGNSPLYVDFHLWIADSAGKNKAQALIAEATPYWKEQFPKWVINTFDSLAIKKVPVRISGWIMWDEDHPDDLGKFRGSLWEIHPMTKFEVYDAGNWHELALLNRDYIRREFAFIF
jgi:hypothetical protein